MEKKRIISFIDWYAPGYKAGGGQRAFVNFVTYMKEYYDFYIITRNTDFLESKPYSEVAFNTWVARSEGEFVYYASEKSIGYLLFKRLFKHVNPDYAYVNGIYSMKFSILPLIVLRGVSFQGRILQGTYGMLATTAINIKKRKKQLFLSVAKCLNLYKKVTFHSTSEGETLDIQKAFGKHVPIIMAPHLPEKKFPQFRSLEKRPGELRLVSVARISPEKNTKYALECLNALAPFEGIIVFDLFGPIYDEPYWTECQNIIKKLPQNIVVNYAGMLDGKEVTTKMMEYHFLFMPTRGENFGYVVLESFMAGRPVIISDRTPWKDLSNKKAGYDLQLEKQILFVQLISQLVCLKHYEFELFCKGAHNLANDFVNNPFLAEVNLKLFDFHLSPGA